MLWLVGSSYKRGNETGSLCDPVGGFCEHGNETSNFVDKAVKRWGVEVKLHAPVYS